ncbi:MAG: hypothetical protein IPI22_11625 [Bacteroidetes bacterium]|nr:hypothetical protein [Bacteroidota bacterium]
MKRIQWIFGLFIMALLWQACHEDTQKKEKTTQNKNHLNIPESGIESMMEENTSKIIEGTQGSVVVTVGEVTRKKADISIKRNDRILDERLIKEHDQMTFDYENNTYIVELKNIKKPLIGAGTAEISIKLQ